MNARLPQVLTLLLVTLSSLLSSGWAATDAGTVIRNVAELSYVDSVTGQPVLVSSGASEIVVSSQFSFELHTGQAKISSAGRFVSFSHYIINTGNASDSYALAVFNYQVFAKMSPPAFSATGPPHLQRAVAIPGIADDTADFDTLVIYHDTNGNGVIDAGEPEVTQSPQLLPGERLELLVQGFVPQAAVPEDIIVVELKAEAQSGSLPAQTNIDSLTVAEAAKFELSKTSSQACSVALLPGQLIDYRIDFANTGDFTPEASRLDVDGVAVSGLVLQDPIPEKTTLVASQSPGFTESLGTPVVQLQSSDEWISFDHWDGVAAVTAMGLYLPAADLFPGVRGHLAFSVIINPDIDATILIENQAFIDLESDNTPEFLSNTVCNEVRGLASAKRAAIRFIEPSLALRQQGQIADFFNNEDFQDAGVFALNNGVRDYAVVNDGVYLEVQVAGLDTSNSFTDSLGVRFVQVNLSSATTGDSVVVLLAEVVPLAGLFRSVEPVTLSNSSSGAGRSCPASISANITIVADFTRASESCVLRSDINDTLTAAFAVQPAMGLLNDQAVVDPSSRVFDSASLLPVAGASVSVRDASNGQLAKHPVTGEELVTVTGSEGFFQFPRLSPDTRYSIEVEPPAGYRFPSRLPASNFTGYSVDRLSYGATGFSGTTDGTFTVNPGEAPPVIDIPLDPETRDRFLLLDKVALQSEVEPGELVVYKLNIRNLGETDLQDVRIEDYLPYGFRYRAGSVQLDGGPGHDPRIIDSRRIDFDLGTLDAGSSATLTYALAATVGALHSDGVNTAVAVASDDGIPIATSPQSSVRVSVKRRGVLSEKAAIFGKLYVDADCNNLQNNGEWPLGGVKLYTQAGTFAITDENGQYSIYGLDPGTHVIKVDGLTLPPGLKLKPLDTRHAADPDSRFVDLSNGDFHRADFAASCPTDNRDEIFAKIKQRNQDSRGTWLLEQAERFDPFAENPYSENDEKRAGIDGDISNGLIDGRPQVPDPRADAKNKLTGESPDTLPGTAVASIQQMPSPAEVVKSVTQGEAKAGTWLWPEKDISLDGRFMAVIRAGITPALLVNGIPVAAEQIGERMLNKKEQAQVVAWYGVKLKPGPNKLEIRGQDPFGNMRTLAQAEYKRPSMGTRLVLRTTKAVLPADGGRTLLPIDVLVRDENDYPAQGVYFVTIEHSGGSVFEEDIQDSEPGHQIKVIDGRGTLHLRSSELTGNIALRASANGMQATLDIAQIASARPLVGVGLVRFGALWGDINDRGLEASDGDELAEEGLNPDSRIALFLKGRIKGDMQLTLAYDSEKKRDTDLLRDINPNAHYPVHGDASQRGYEAQSRSKLYAKVERGQHSLMWGDYVTDANRTSNDLARVQRTLTGLNGIYSKGKSQLQVFAARTQNARKQEEIRGNGTAMLFRLQGVPIVANSEVVERVVRNRQSPGIIESTVRLSRFGDYLLDSVTGEMRFSSVVPFFDADGNPVSIRVSYDQATDGEEHTVAGMRAQRQLSQKLTVGASYTRDQAPIDGNSVIGAFADYAPDAKTRIGYSLAHMTQRNSSRSGVAHRLVMERQWNERKNRHTSLTFSTADMGFDNPGSGIAAGQTELRINHQQGLGAAFKTNAEVIHSESELNNDRRSTAALIVEKTRNQWLYRAGPRRVHERIGDDREAYSTLLLGAERRFLYRGRAGTAGIEYEQDTGQSERRRFTLDGRLKVHEHAQLYGRYETQNQISDFALRESASKTEEYSMGVESDWLPGTRLYSEMRLRGAIDGRDYESGSGVKGNYQIRPGISITPALEIINTHSGDSSNDAKAVSLSVTDKRNRNARSSAHIEYRKSRTSDYFGFRVNHVARLNLDWTLLLKEELTRQQPGDGEITQRHVLSVGMSRRPRLGNRNHLLFVYNWKEELGPDVGADRSTHLFSVHNNFQPHSRLVFSTRFGAKWQTTDLASGEFKSQATLLDGRISYDLDQRLDLDLRAGLISTASGQGVQTSIGTGLSYLVDRNLRFGVGYNFTGFRDDDLDAQGFNAHGVHIGFDYKFDEDAFDWLKY